MLTRWRGAVALLLLGAATGAGVSSCGGVAFTIANAPALVGAFDRHAAIAYAGDSRQRLDVFVPRGARAAPVVVFWYGGSWERGSREQYRFAGAALAEAGFVTVLPDYRLYPQVRFPAFVQDAALAFRWVQEHAAEYGGDPRRIFLMGHSAGAHQAAMLALDPQWIRAAGGDASAVRGLIGLSGPYVLKPNTAALNTIFAAPYRSADWQPLQHVTSDAPPALLIHGAADDLVAPLQSEQLDAALRAAGVESTLLLVPQRSHADIVAALSVPARARAPVLLEVRRFIAAHGGR